MSIKYYPIALNLPTVVALLIVFGRHVVQMMTNSTWFTGIDLTKVTEHLDQLEAAQVLAKGRGKGTAGARNDAQKVVVDDLVGLKGIVATVVSKNPGQAETIVTSAGMSLKRFTRVEKAVLRAFLGSILAQIEVVAKAVPKAGAYEWQYSIDGGHAWVSMPVTTVAHTSLPGVVVGTTYLFRFRTTRRNVVTDWSPTASLTVK
jgi:hypothetical protein